MEGTQELVVAWIESHQDLAHHPKVARLARALDVSIPAAIGHLHCFWWWCLSYAEDGDVTGYDAPELALGAQWDGDPDRFIVAMQDGWIDDGQVHDWWDYAGKLVEKRRSDAARKRSARATDVPRTSSGHPTPVAGTNQPTNPTNQTAPAADVQFEVFHKERALEEVRRRRSRGIHIRSEGGLAKTIAEDPEFLASSKRAFEHQSCKRCRGKGTVDLHAPGGDATINCPGEEQ